MKLRLNNGPLLSVVFTALLIVWMLSGLAGQPEASEPAPAEKAAAEDRMRVQVKRLTASPVERAVMMQGNTAPGRAVTVRAEIAGKVKKIAAVKGQALSRNSLILQIDPEDLPERYQRAKDLAEQRRLEYEGAKKLHKRGLLSPALLAESRAQLSAAQADVAAIETHGHKGRITAPFDGVLDTRPVELGDYLKAGDTVGKILDFTPFLVTGSISELEAPSVHPGITAEVELTTGEKMQGRIRYVASEADPATRTVPVEIEVDAANAPMLAGITASVRIPVATVNAHQMSPALLTLDQQGKLGVKIVDSGNTVRLLPVRIVRADASGVWIEGLPESVDMIMVGAGFVNDGDQVEPVQMEAPKMEAPKKATSAGSAA